MEKIALIELTGATSVLSIYQTQNGRSKLIRQESDAVNVSKDINEEKLLKPKTIADVVGILKLYRDIVEENQVQKIICTANNCVLGARNQRGFFGRRQRNGSAC